MQDISPVIIAACGLGIVCVGLILLLAFVMLRFTGTSILGPLLALVRGADVDEDIETSYREQRPRPSTRRPSVRPPSANLDDFDAAVERYRQQGGRPSSQPGVRRPSQLRGDALNKDYDEPVDNRRPSRDDDYEIYDDEDEGGFFDL
jgi:hypothetical protein